MLTKSGVKLLDFGLAKASGPPSGWDLSMAPTTPAGLTAQGTILGTFQYMAPEQLEGKEADARTDIFAFGAVLYEMVTGKKAFEGKSQASLIGAIHEQRAAADVGAAAARRRRRSIVSCRRALRRIRTSAGRPRAISCDELKWIAEAARRLASRLLAAPARRLSRVARVARGRRRLVAGRASRSRCPRWPPVAKRRALAPSMRARDRHARHDRSISFALSPDGRQIVFVASGDGASRLWLRPLDATDRAAAGRNRRREPLRSGRPTAARSASSPTAS